MATGVRRQCNMPYREAIVRTGGLGSLRMAFEVNDNLVNFKLPGRGQRMSLTASGSSHRSDQVKRAASTNDSGWGIRAEGAPSRSAEGAPLMAMSADRRECAAVRWSGQKHCGVDHGQRYARAEISTLVYGDGRTIQLTLNPSLEGWKTLGL